MRVMLTVQMDTVAANQMIVDGSLEKGLGTMFEQLKPEAAYFGTKDGCRTAFVVFDLQDPSQIPAVAEPLFQGSLAKLSLQPVMNLDDLRKGLTELAKH